VPRRFRRQCPLCYSNTDSTVEVCEWCAKEHGGLQSLYTRVVMERPHLKKLGPLDVFSKMYQRLKELEDAVHCKPNETERADRR
jgi:hypothetical protein